MPKLLDPEYQQLLNEFGYKKQSQPQPKLLDPEYQQLLNEFNPKNSYITNAGWQPTQDYDYKGYKEEYGSLPNRAEGHLTDKYKKPSHITFSTDSKYSNEKTTGGKWEQRKDGKWQYTPSDYVLSQHPREELQKYFKEQEPDSILNLPPSILGRAKVGIGYTGTWEQPSLLDKAGKAITSAKDVIKEKVVKPIQEAYQQPLEKPKTVGEFFYKTIPSSFAQTVYGLGAFPIQFTDELTKPIIDNVAKRIKGEHKDTGEMWKAITNDYLETGAQTVEGFEKFNLEPIGVFGWESMKNRWMSDPVGSGLGISPLLGGIKALAALRRVTKVEPAKVVLEGKEQPPPPSNEELGVVVKDIMDKADKTKEPVSTVIEKELKNSVTLHYKGEGKPTEHVFTEVPLSEGLKPDIASVKAEEIPSEGKPVPQEVLKDYPELQIKETPEFKTSAKVQVGKSPQVYELIKEQPFDVKTDIEGERYFDIKNIKTGDIQTVEMKDLKLIKEKTEAVSRELSAKQTREIEQIKKDIKDVKNILSDSVSNSTLRIYAKSLGIDETNIPKGREGRERIWELVKQREQKATAEIKSEVKILFNQIYGEGSFEKGYGLKKSISGKGWNAAIPVEGRIGNLGVFRTREQALKAIKEAQEQTRPKGESLGAKLTGAEGETPSAITQLKESAEGTFSKEGGEIKDAYSKIAEPKPAIGDFEVERGKIDAETAKAKKMVESIPIKQSLDSLGTLRKTYQDVKDIFTKLPNETVFNNILGTYQNARRKYIVETKRFAKILTRLLPEDKRKAISNWRQANGDIELLKERARLSLIPNEKTKGFSQKYREELSKGYLDATKLTPDEKVFAQNIRNYYDAMEKDAIEYGLFEDGVENYVNQMWDVNSGFKKKVLSVFNGGMLQKNPAFIKERKFDDYFTGEQLGYKPRNKDIVFLVSNYNVAFNEAVAAREFVRTLLRGKIEDDINEMDINSRERIEKLLENVKGVTSSLRNEIIKALSETKVEINPLTGEERGLNTATRQKILSLLKDKKVLRPLAVVEGIYDEETSTFKSSAVHSDYGQYRMVNHPSMRKWKWVGNDAEGNPIRAEGNIRVFYSASNKMIYKQINSLLGRSKFRDFEIKGVRVGAGLLRVSSEVKHTILSAAILPSPFHQVHLGITSLEHRVNPFNPSKIAIDDPIFEHGTINGLVTGGDYADMTMFEEGTVSHSFLINKIPYFGRAIQRYEHYLFGEDGYIPRLKWDNYQAILQRNIDTYSDMGKLSLDEIRNAIDGKIEWRGKQSLDQIAELTANQVNASFGMQNYARLGRSRTVQDALRLALLAPDFLESRVKSTAQLFTAGRREQLTAFLIGTAGQALIAKTLELIINGNVDDDPKHLLMFKSGDKEYGVRSKSGDILSVWNDFFGALRVRTNPLIIGLAVKLMWGIDEYGNKVKGLNKVKDEITGLLPIPLQGFARSLFKAQEVNIAKSLLQPFGITAQKYKTPAERAMSDIYSGYNFPPSDNPEKKKQLIKWREQYAQGKMDEILEAYDSGKISDREAEYIKTPAISKSFEGLQNFDDVIRVWKLANPKEKKMWAGIFIKKANNKWKNSSPEERAIIEEKMEALYKKQ